MKLVALTAALLLIASAAEAHHCYDPKNYEKTEVGRYDHGKRLGAHKCVIRMTPGNRRKATRCLLVQGSDGKPYCQ